MNLKLFCFMGLRFVFIREEIALNTILKSLTGC